MRGGGARAGQGMCSRSIERRHRPHPQMSQVFQLGEVGQLEVEGVNENPAVDVECAEHSPQQTHCYVVSEY